MDIDSVFGNRGEGARPLPKPTATFVSSDGIGEMTEGKIRGIVCNPVYAGIGPFPGFITDEQWVRTAVAMIAEDGPEQFLVNLLHILRASFAASDEQ